MKTEVYKNPMKNLSGEWVGQIDRGDVQVQIFASTRTERNSVIDGIKKILPSLMIKCKNKTD